MSHENRDTFDLTLISRRYPPQIGGAEKVMSNMAEAFAALGPKVTVLTSADPSEGIAASARRLPASDSEKPVVIRLPYNGIRWVGTALYMRRLRQWIASHRPRLIYVSMLKHDAYVATKCGKALGIPVVLRPEGAGDTGDMAWQRQNRFGGKIRSVVRHADAFVALSDRIRDELIEAGYDSGRITVIPNGVPIPERQWSGRTVDSPTAVFVGRLATEKGVDRLLAAWPIVMMAKPRARLRLVGGGTEEEKLRAQAKNLGIDDSVEFFGARTDVQEILLRSDLFVLPSREEGLSIALLEAMAVGMPVVVSDIPGNRTLVSDGVTGRLVDPDASEAFASAILEAFAAGPRIRSLAQAGRELVADRYSIRSAAQRHLALFRELIGDSTRREITG